MGGTIFSPHKPYVPGLCGQGARVAIAVAMDHPSGDFQLPRYTRIHHAGMVA